MPVTMMRPAAPSAVLRTIAAVEAVKGLLALVAGAGMLSLVHRDVPTAAESLLRLAHFDPASRYAGAFLEAAGRVSDGDLRLLAALAFFYAAIRIGEAYWLWNAQPWAEWFALGSTCFYLPAALYELTQHPNGLTVGALFVNLAIIGYLARALRHDDRWTRLLSRPRTSQTRAAALTGNPS